MNISGNHEILLHAVGDVGLMGKVADNIRDNGSSFPFKECASTLRDANIIFGNIEMPFSLTNKEYYSHISKKSKVDIDAVNSLKDAGFNLMSLANNHIMDYGPSGIADTISILSDAGIAHAGAGMNLEESRRPAVVKVNDRMVGLLAYSMIGPHSARENTPGAAPMEIKAMIDDLQLLRSSVDIVIVSLHFGMIYTDYPTSEQRNLCHKLIDSGATLVLGHHPHVLQGIEPYGAGLIAYSMGEFIFDATFGNVYSTVARDKRKESIILKCLLKDDGSVNHEIIPVRLNQYLQPCIESGLERQAMIKRMGKLSTPLIDNSLDDSEVFKRAGSDLMAYQMQVYLFHLKKLNLSYIAKQLLRLRWRHFKLVSGFIRSQFIKKD